jgi:hypothetical protein
MFIYIFVYVFMIKASIAHRVCFPMLLAPQADFVIHLCNCFHTSLAVDVAIPLLSFS